MQVKPFGKLRKSNADGAKPRLKDLISYDMKQMHAAFTGTVPIGHQGMALIGTDVSVTHVATMSCVTHCCDPLEAWAPWACLSGVLAFYNLHVRRPCVALVPCIHVWRPCVADYLSKCLAAIRAFNPALQDPAHGRDASDAAP